MRDRWVVLDVGEVLVDETRIWSTWADVLGITRFSLMAALGVAIVREGDHRQAFPLAGAQDWAVHHDRVEAAYGGFGEQDLYPDARRGLRRLSDRGYRVAVVANQPARRHDELTALGIVPEVMAMSGALGVEKPDPAFFARMLELLGSPEPDRVAYVGDRVDNDVRPAAGAGLRAVWLRRGPWGLLQEDPQATAVLAVASLDELVARIDEVWRPRSGHRAAAGGEIED